MLFLLHRKVPSYAIKNAPRKKDIIIDYGSMFSGPQFYGETQGMTELLIDYYLEEQEVQSTFYD